jgi:predicted CXXCH cytochrome family protein
LTTSGQPHNFSTESWNPPVSVGSVYVSGAQICQPCHTPHNANTSIPSSLAPLWNRALSSATYTMYTPMTGNGHLIIPNAPNGTSALCLSCHDGTVALGSYGGQTGTTTMAGFDNGLASLGTDLSNDHPISISYQMSIDSGYASSLRAQSVLYSTYTSPGVYTATTSAVSTLLDANGQVQCTSCHTPHANSNGYQLGRSFKGGNIGSQICLVCHSK